MNFEWSEWFICPLLPEIGDWVQIEFIDGKTIETFITHKDGNCVSGIPNPLGDVSKEMKKWRKRIDGEDCDAIEQSTSTST